MKKLDNKWKLAIIGGSVLISLAVAYSVFKVIQRKNAREVLDKRIMKQFSLSLSDAFNKTRWKSGKPVISDATGRYVAKLVHDAIGYFSEDETAITKAFNAVRNYDDLSLISYQFSSLFGEDLNTEITKAYAGDDVKLAEFRTLLANKIYK